MSSKVPKKPTVSVLMPAYNAEKYVSEAIESILNQTYKDFELIVVDDASKDETWRIIQEYQKKDSRVRVFRNKKNLYIAGNRNILLSKARGKYVVWQDADDISLPDRVQKQVYFMDNNPEVGICGGWLESFKDDLAIDTRKYFPDDKRLRAHIFRASPVAQPAAIIRKECFDKVGYYNTNCPPAEDLDMSFRIGTYYKFANLQETVIKYREHPNSATSKKLRKIVMITLRIRISNIKNNKYSFNVIDFLALILTYIVQFLPPYLTIKLFKLLRNS